jgi:hypothetical protein
MDERTIKSLVTNSQSALFAAVEIHNKPIFPYRYEVCTILLVNSWELILKAFLIERRPDIKISKDDGSTKTFEESITNVLSTIGKEFLLTSENLLKLYEYRCNMIHFYNDRIDIILYSLISKSVLLYHEFMVNHFDIDISKRANLVLLPIGFTRPISPIDFLSNESETTKASEDVQLFIKGIVDSAKKLEEEGLEDSILVNYRMSVINENRLKNSDIIAAITKDGSKAAVHVEKVIKEFRISDDENVQKIKIDEDNLFKTVYTLTYRDITLYGQRNYSDFKMNAEFYALLKEIKKNPNLHRVRYLDVDRESGVKKDYYSKDVYKEFDKHYRRITK